MYIQYVKFLICCPVFNISDLFCVFQQVVMATLPEAGALISPATPSTHAPPSYTEVDHTFSGLLPCHMISFRLCEMTVIPEGANTYEGFKCFPLIMLLSQSDETLGN